MSSDDREAIDDAARMARAIEALLERTAAAVDACDRPGIRIAEAIARSLSDQLASLLRSHAA